MTSPADFPSGFSLLQHSRVARIIACFWKKLDDWTRRFLPVLHIGMLAVIALILGAVVFANQHLPCWYDEIYMLDPAFYRTTTGIWQSRATCDAIGTIPFAPNYPLLCSFLCLCVSLFGVRPALLRGCMLLLGLIPFVVIIAFLHRKGLFYSKRSVLYAAYFLACFSFFPWALYIRPEAITLLVIALVVLTWGTRHSVFLFFFSFLLPLCGLQWNVLLLPAIFHWLVFGGRLRNPVVVVGGLCMGTLSVLTAYHLLGMWPSYLQEAARVGGLDAVAHFRMRLLEIYHLQFHAWLNPKAIPPPVAVGLELLCVGGALCLFRHRPFDVFSVKCWLFSTFSVVLVLGALGLLAWLPQYYTRPVAALSCLCFPLVFGRTWDKHPFLLLLMALFPLYPSTLPLWHKIRDDGATEMGVVRSTPWMDEATLGSAIGSILSPDDEVCCDASAYFAVRAHCREMMPLCYAFDLSTAQVHSIDAVLLEDQPVSRLMKDYATPNARGAHWQEAMLSAFPPCPNEDPWETLISPDNLLAAIAEHWHCTFKEIPLPGSSQPNTLRFRLFRPVFSDSDGNFERVEKMDLEGA